MWVYVIDDIIYWIIGLKISLSILLRWPFDIDFGGCARGEGSIKFRAEFGGGFMLLICDQIVNNGMYGGEFGILVSKL